MTYFNTTNLAGTQLEIKVEKARTQQEVIMTLYHTHPVVEYTPFEILRMWPGRKPPITSIRRCLTVLTAQGKLIKTDIKRVGEYGELNHTWKLKL
jgi:hypothetical protein